MKKISTAIALAAMLPAIAGAQSLNKEITVERDIVPQQREASRMTFTPRVTLRPVTLKRLSYSETGVTANVPASISTLDPAAYGDSIYMTPYRGYVAVGIGNMFNPDLSVGYRAVATERTRLNISAQYNGSNYRHTPEAAEGNIYLRRHTATGAIDLHQAVGRTSALDAGIDYTFGRFTVPFATWRALREPVADEYWQNVNRLNAGLNWSSTINDLYYNIGASFSRFAFGNSPVAEAEAYGISYNPDYTSRFDRADIRPMRESVIGVDAAIGARLGESSLAELGVDFSNVSNSHYTNRVDFSVIDKPLPGSVLSPLRRGDAVNHWLLRLTPRYRYTSGHATIDLGARIDLTHNAGKAFHIAPDVTIGFNPSSKFAVTVRAGGGEVQNTLSSIYDATPYFSPLFAYANSHIPLTLDANITIGPFRGAYVELFGGYARANDWLLPVGGMMNGCVTEDIRGWHAGAAIGFRYNSLLDFRTSFEAAPSAGDKGNRGYYLWRDLATKVVEASLTVRPIKPLGIDLGYQFRSGRFNSLGTVSDLSAGASWRFSQQLTAFLRGENLMNRSYMMLGGVAAQGIHGTVGAAYKF